MSSLLFRTRKPRSISVSASAFIPVDDLAGLQILGIGHQHQLAVEEFGARFRVGVEFIGEQRGVEGVERKDRQQVRQAGLRSAVWVAAATGSRATIQLSIAISTCFSVAYLCG